MTSWTVGPANRVCNCRFDRPGLDQQPLDDGDRALLGDVERYGWHILQVTESGPSPGWVFSAGMWHTLGSPEIGIFGLAASDGAHAINRIGEAIRSGLELGPSVVFRDALEGGWPIAFRLVHESWYRPLFGYALWFGQMPPLPIVQAIWADPHGRFPWDAGFDPAYADDQPSLWIPAAEHPPSRWPAR